MEVLNKLLANLRPVQSNHVPLIALAVADPSVLNVVCKPAAPGHWVVAASGRDGKVRHLVRVGQLLRPVADADGLFCYI